MHTHVTKGLRLFCRGHLWSLRANDLGLVLDPGILAPSEPVVEQVLHDVRVLDFEFRFGFDSAVVAGQLPICDEGFHGLKRLARPVKNEPAKGSGACVRKT